MWSCPREKKKKERCGAREILVICGPKRSDPVLSRKSSRSRGAGSDRPCGRVSEQLEKKSFCQLLYHPPAILGYACKQTEVTQKKAVSPPRPCPRPYLRKSIQDGKAHRLYHHHHHDVEFIRFRHKIKFRFGVKETKSRSLWLVCPPVSSCRGLRVGPALRDGWRPGRVLRHELPGRLFRGIHSLVRVGIALC